MEGDRIAVIAKRPGVSLAALFAAAGVGADVAAEAVVAAEIEIKYDGYLAREREAAARLAELAAFVLPSTCPTSSYGPWQPKHARSSTACVPARSRRPRASRVSRPAISTTSFSRRRGGAAGSPRIPMLQFHVKRTLFRFT